MAEQKQKTAAEIKEWYEKNKRTIENFERSSNALQLLDPTKNYSRTASTFNKETLRTYMKNPTSYYKNLRNLSRFLYYRSQVYRRLIHYNANMIDLNYRSVIPLIDLVKGGDQKAVLQSYYDTLLILENMNLPLEFLKAYITCWREDVFFGCAYYDDTGFFILPLDPDYCKVTGIYPTGDLAFDFSPEYFSKKQEVVEMLGEPFTTLWNEYQKDTRNNKWLPFPDEYAVCLKLNIDDWEIPIPWFVGLFNSLINLADVEDNEAVAAEQQIYKLLALTIPLIKNGEDSDEWAVDPETAIAYFNKIKEILPYYTDAIILPGLDIEPIEFNKDSVAADVNRVETATKTVLNTSGGAQILNSSSISGTTAFNAAIKSDEDMALSSLLPQTQSWLKRFLSYQLKNPAKVKFIEVTKYTAPELRDSVLKAATYGVPNKLLLNTLNGGFSELDTLSLAFLENDCLKLSEKFVPLQSSNTQNTGELNGGGQEKSDSEITDDGEASKEKRDKSK